MTPEDRLIAAVEGLSVEPGSFGHEAHVRLAFSYLDRCDLFEALARCRAALRRFADHVGAEGKYHETVTCALVFLIHERKEAMRARAAGNEIRPPGGTHPELVPRITWSDFAAANPDLLRWKDGTFFDYYPDEVLGSELARRTFVLPHPGVRLQARVMTGGEAVGSASGGSATAGVGSAA